METLQSQNIDFSSLKKKKNRNKQNRNIFFLVKNDIFVKDSFQI